MNGGTSDDRSNVIGGMLTVQKLEREREKTCNSSRSNFVCTKITAEGNEA